MLIFNHIVNSRIFRILPFSIANYLLKNIIYFKRSNFKKLINNYNLNVSNIDNLKLSINNRNSHITCPYLSNILHLLFRNEKYNFFDFGCGNLNLYHEITYDSNINYIAYDQEKIIQVIKENIDKNQLKNITASEMIEDVNIDFLYFGASFQYIENIENYFQKFKNFSNSKYIFLSGIIVYEKDSSNKFIVSQHNVPSDMRMLYFFNKQYLKKFFNKINYSVVFEKKNFSDKYLNFRNFKNLDLNYYDILFKKNEK